MDRSKALNVATSLAKGLIEDQFPRLRPLRLAALGQGWDNAVFRVNGRYVFRFPIRDVAVPLIETEAALLPFIGAKLGLAVPRPRFFGRPAPGFARPFLGYDYVPGTQAAGARLTDAQRAASSGLLGRFLKRLHAMEPDEARKRGAGPDHFGRTNVERRREMTLPRLRALAKRGLLKKTEALERILASTLPSPEPDVLLHGDPHAGQLLLDCRGKVCGVIDWGDLHIGHRAVDLSIAFTFLPPSAHADFRRAYGPISPRTWALARFRGLCVMTALAEHAVEHREPRMLRAALAGLRFVAAPEISG